MDKIETQSDWIWGAKAIGQECNLTERQANYLLALKLLPAKKLKGRYVSSRRVLRDFATTLQPAQPETAA